MGQYTDGARNNRDGAIDSKWAAEDSDLSARWPAVFEYLCERLNDDGKPRRTSTILLFAEDGVFKFCLTDRESTTGDFEYSIWVSGSTFGDGLANLDEALRDPNTSWRRRPKFVQGKRR